MPARVITYEELKPGQEFPPVIYRLTANVVAAYILAVRDVDRMYARPEDMKMGWLKPTALVPPTAVAALAMKGLLASVVLPPGSVHVSQELEFLKPAMIGDSITCKVSIGKKLERRGLRLVSFELSADTQSGVRIMTGRALVTVPDKA